ncbi:hypothetical protein NPIL_615661 [Nephila pilipes]|uniref:Uncharacterized protein n=1 Tax=Nephila pilipes TaxID=299642 RepID=A0A8X6NCP2_NEPPI|nr:hypothetical protein NPIL_615661 [Nephila pilipes]
MARATRGRSGDDDDDDIHPSKKRRLLQLYWKHSRSESKKILDVPKLCPLYPDYIVQYYAFSFVCLPSKLSAYFVILQRSVKSLNLIHVNRAIPKFFLQT